MSNRVLNAVWEHSSSTGNDRLVLLVLADAANPEQRVAWPSVKFIAERCGGIEPRTVQRCLRRLEHELHEIETVTNGGHVDGRNQATTYRVTVGWQSDAPRQDGQGEEMTLLSGGGDAAVAPTLREPSTTSTSSSGTARARPGWLPQSVGGLPVTAKEAEWTDSLLDVFNEVSDKRFSGKSWRESIVRRLREHPEIGLDEHEAIVRGQFERPWWKGDPTPSVIWGNDRVFDRALNRAQGPRPERTTGYNLPEDHPRAFTVRR